MDFIYFSSQLDWPPRFENFPQTYQCDGFLVFGNFLYYKTPFLGRVSVPNSIVSLFLLYFVLPPFEDNGLLFWASDVLC